MKKISWPTAVTITFILILFLGLFITNDPVEIQSSDTDTLSPQALQNSIFVPVSVPEMVGKLWIIYFSGTQMGAEADCFAINNHRLDDIDFFLIEIVEHGCSEFSGRVISEAEAVTKAEEAKLLPLE